MKTEIKNLISEIQEDIETLNKDLIKTTIDNNRACRRARKMTMKLSSSFREFRMQTVKYFNDLKEQKKKED